MKVLLTEDDEPTAAYIAKGLRRAGHEADSSADGRDGLVLATTCTYDAAVVDRMVPGLDGLALVRTLRSIGAKLPILLLTALGGIDDRVEGLEAGADDYLGKPFAFSGVMARLNALARRPPITSGATTVQVGDLLMDLLARTVRRAGRPVSLQPREFKLLEGLMRNRGRVGNGLHSGNAAGHGRRLPAMIALRRSIAVRLAALFFLLFAGAIGAAFAASYWFVRAEIVSRMRADLAARADAIASRLRTQSPEIALSSETGRRVAAVFDASGALVAGQPALSPVVGWREIAAAPLR